MAIGRGTSWLRVRLIVPLVIALGATIGISQLRDYADSRRTGQMLLVRIESVANRQSVEESSVTSLGLATKGRVDGIFGRQIESLETDIRDLRSLAGDDLDRLRDLGLGGPGLEHVSTAFANYQKVLDIQMRLIADHEFDQAFRYDRERIEPAFVSLNLAIGDSESRFDVLAGQASLVADVGTFTVVLMAFGGLVLLSRRAEKQRRRLEEQLRHQAFHDSLTDLANRALFTDRVDHALARSNRKDELLGVLFIDLDGFKNINDSLGHETGDRVLRIVAERLTSCTRDIDTVARFGGDEFAILLEDIADPDAAIEVAERVIDAFGSAFDLDDRRVMVTASVGIATSEKGENVESLLANADVAMYAAKARGKSCHELFRPGMRAALQERIELQGAFEEALRLDQLVLHYQPVVDLASRRIIGVEALVRWMHPEKGLVPPGAFIPMAEETGLILPLGRWVLRTACLQARQWQIVHPQTPPLRVSINLSARQYQDDSLVEDVATALEESGIPPGSLVLEITETALMRDTEGTVERLGSLKDLGVRLAVDDFGTGYSSLSYLRRFPVDWLKIDRSFVAVMTEAAEDLALVQAVMKLAESMGLAVVAEGIERPDQLESLRRLGCKTGQGFLFAAPVAPGHLESLLATQVPTAGGAALPEQAHPGVSASDEGTGEAR